MTNFPGAEHIIYAALFSLGLLISVYAMINGSVKQVHDPALMKAPPAALNLFVVGASVTVLGAVGYLFARYSQFDTIMVLASAVLGGALGWIGMTTLMAQWAFKGPLVDPHEDMEELQGTVAMVIQDITPEIPGEISYIFRGETLTAPAICISETPVSAGTEVIIDVIKDGLAEIEIWSIVEERINGVAHE